jgi:hypothetical protein
MRAVKNSITTSHGHRRLPAAAKTGASQKERPLKTANSPAPNTPDFRFENHFSICLLRPLTDAARAWVEDHIGADNGYQPQWPSVLLEPRYCGDVLVGIADAGLVVR